MLFQPSPEETQRRDAIMDALLRATEAGTTIKLPAYDPEVSIAAEEFAATTVGIEPNPYGGTVGDLRYQFEGEEDLLHLIVTRLDNGPIRVEEGQAMGDFLFTGVPKSLFWFRPGTVSQHFYIGHDHLLAYWNPNP